MSLQCGIVGLPNVGKSTLFNALTKAGIAAENYPFCTIEPNVGVVEVPDPRLQKLAAIDKPLKVIPAIVEFVDIAGLVAGASKGEGLGNQFLANIRETNAIANVVRCFEDGNVIHVNNKVDPISDIEVIHTELALADMQSIEKAKHRFGKTLRAGDKEAMKMVPLLERVEKALDGLHPVRAMGLTADEMALLQPLQLLTAKPALYIANVGEHGFADNPLLERVKAYAAKEGAPVVAISAKLESEIAGLEDEEKQMFLADMGMSEPGLDRLLLLVGELGDLALQLRADGDDRRAFLRGIFAHTLQQRVVFEAMLAHVGDVERGLGGEQLQRLQQRHLVGAQPERADRVQAVERLLDPLEQRDDLHRFLVAGAQGLAEAVLGLLDRLHVGQRELGVDHLDVGDRVDLVVHVDHVAVLEAAHHVGDRVGLADVGEELVPEALALGGARDQAGDVDELDDRRDHLQRLVDGGELREARVGHFHHAHVRLDGAERIVLRGDAGLGERVEERRLADVGQADDAALQCHVVIPLSVRRAVSGSYAARSWRPPGAR